VTNDVEVASGIEERYELRNTSGLSDSEIMGDANFRKAAKEISRWADNLRSVQQRGSMFDRAAFTPPDNIYDEMRSARIAVEHDDIVSGTADITESFAFQGMKWESVNSDEADIFNQWSAEIDMDSVLRRIWREDFTVSQAVIATTWGWREYTVRGKGPDIVDPAGDPVSLNDPEAELNPLTGQPKPPKKKGRKRRKTYRLWVPTQLTVLDSTKIVPVNFSPMMPEQLAWCASEAEMGHWKEVSEGRVVDLPMETFFIGHYKPSKGEEMRLRRMGIPVDKLLLLNPEMVWRHTLTKADYEAWPVLRMKSLFGLLDMKRQLINADRAALIGAANYILLVKKGTDERPATQEEVSNLKENYNFIAKMPVIISDHRLELEIVAPKVDLTLNGEKYDTLDTRILMRLLGTLSLGSKGQRNETNITLSNAVARMMENRRHMIRRSIERNIAKKIVEHPLNKKATGQAQIEDEPNLVFLPRHVTLGFDAALIQAMVGLRTQREISRETILEQFGLDQATEALRMEHEEEFYDDIFKTQIPFAAPGQGGPDGGDTTDTGDPKANGAQGGRPLGGGKPSQDTTKPKAKSPSGNSTRDKS
jgi:hypothetical protein